jgi:hypothetical protein
MARQRRALNTNYRRISTPSVRCWNGYIHQVANCATLINVMKLTKGLPLFAFAPLIFAQTSPPVAPGSVRPDGAYQVGNGVSPPSVMFRTTWIQERPRP